MDPRHQRLERQIEALVRAHLESCRRAAAAAVDRALVAATSGPPTIKRQSRKAPQVQYQRRSAEELARLEDQFYAAVCATPGETMTVLAARIGMSSRRLAVPVRRLRRAGRVRMIGRQSGARYFPMVEERATNARLVVVEARS